MWCIIFQFLYSSIQACRRLIKGHFDIWAYEVMNVDYQCSYRTRDSESSGSSDGGSHKCKDRPLVKTLVRLLQCQNDNLQRRSAQLLFDMHKRESILFSDATASYLVTWHSFHIFTDLLQLGSLSDANKLLVKMHQGKLGDDKQALLSELNKIAACCVLDDDPTLPHACYQWITYSTSGLMYFSFALMNDIQMNSWSVQGYSASCSAMSWSITLYPITLMKTLLQVPVQSWLIVYTRTQQWVTCCITVAIHNANNECILLRFRPVCMRTYRNCWMPGLLYMPLLNYSRRFTRETIY